MSCMAMGARNPPVMGSMGVGFQLLRPFSNGCVAFVAFQTRFPVGNLRRALSSMAIGAGNAESAMDVFSFLLLLGHSCNGEHNQGRNYKNSYHNRLSIHLLIVCA